MEGIVSIYLDGPRERTVELPDNWHELDDEERRAVVIDTVKQMTSDALDWTISTEYDEETT